MAYSRNNPHLPDEWLIPHNMSTNSRRSKSPWISEQKYRNYEEWLILSALLKIWLHMLTDVTQTDDNIALAVFAAPNLDNTHGLSIPSMQFPSICWDWECGTRQHFRIPWEIHLVDIVFSHQNKVVASGTKVCQTLAKICVVYR